MFGHYQGQHTDIPPSQASFPVCSYHMLPLQLNMLSLEVETSGYDSLILYFTVNIAHMQTENSCNVTS